MVSEVHNMDCMEYMRNIPDKFFELAVVDPPYGINAPNMSMGSNMNRRHGGYNGESIAQRLKRKRFNQGAGKLKNRALNYAMRLGLSSSLKRVFRRTIQDKP